jgi:hypothetical protein
MVDAERSARRHAEEMLARLEVKYARLEEDTDEYQTTPK